jgi:hypothetical protein
MSPNTFRIIKNAYIAYAIVYVILCLVGGSILLTEWNPNGLLGAALVVTIRTHMALANPIEF